MKKNYQKLLEAQTAQLGNLTATELKQLNKQFNTWRKQLREDLLATVKPGDSFTVARMKAMQAQIDHAIAQIALKLKDNLVQAGETAATMATQHITNQAAAAMADLGVPPANLDVDMLARLNRDNSLLLDRTSKYSKKWNKTARKRVKAHLATHIAKQTPVNEIITDMTKTNGIMENDRRGAQRLYRTEIAHAYNNRTHDDISELAKRAPDRSIKKRLVNPIDARTAHDTLAIISLKDNLIKDPDEPFQDPVNGKTFMYPPNRPNDRARIVMAFGTPQEDQAQNDEAKKADAETAKRNREKAEKKTANKRRPDGRPAKTNPKPSTKKKKSGKGNTSNDKHLVGKTKTSTYTDRGYKKLTYSSNLSQETAERVASALEHPEIKDLLKKNPINELRIGKQKSNAPSGLCISKVNTRTNELIKSDINIKTNIKRGRDYATGKTIEDYPFTFSQTKSSQLDAIKVAVHHEAGHHLYYSSPKVKQIVRQKHRQHMVELTEYQKKDHREYFSESLAMYLDDPKKFKELDSHGHSMVKECLDELRKH